MYRQCSMMRFVAAPVAFQLRPPSFGPPSLEVSSLSLHICDAIHAIVTPLRVLVQPSHVGRSGGPPKGSCGPLRAHDICTPGSMTYKTLVLNIGSFELPITLHANNSKICSCGPAVMSDLCTLVMAAGCVPAQSGRHDGSKRIFVSSAMKVPSCRNPAVQQSRASSRHTRQHHTHLAQQHTHTPTPSSPPHDALLNRRAG